MIASRAARAFTTAATAPHLAQHIPTLAPLSHAALQIQHTKTPKPKPQDPSTLGFGKTFTDHMLTIAHTKAAGWADPRIVPYQNLSLPPSTSSLHYAIQCFEGMKAFRGDDGHIRLFRNQLNYKRLNKSSARICLPTFDAEEFHKCLVELLKIDQDWIPKGRGYSGYIRPTAISTDPTLGVAPPQSSLLYVIVSPVAGYYSAKPAPVRLHADPCYVRAWPGGTGDAKLGANYAPGLLPQLESKALGCDQVLWLFGPEEHLTEVGTMNLFFDWTNENGQRELCTAPLDGTILEGVTRQSVIELAQEEGHKVAQRFVGMQELITALYDGRLHEMFGSGTAASISPVKEILYKGKTLEIPCGESGGPLAQHLKKTLDDIQYGAIEHEWAPVVV